MKTLIAATAILCGPCAWSVEVTSFCGSFQEYIGIRFRDAKIESGWYHQFYDAQYVNVGTSGVMTGIHVYVHGPEFIAEAQFNNRTGELSHTMTAYDPTWLPWPENLELLDVNVYLPFRRLTYRPDTGVGLMEWSAQPLCDRTPTNVLLAIAMVMSLGSRRPNSSKSPSSRE
jgi:hypothetical protein